MSDRIDNTGIARDRIPVITGVGVVSPFGSGTQSFYDGLVAGRCAVGPIRSFDATTFPTRVAGEVPAETIDAITAPRELPSGAWRDRKLRFALAAAREAWTGAGCGDAQANAWLSMAVGLEQAFLGDFAPSFDGHEIDWQAEHKALDPQIRTRSPVDLSTTWVRKTLGLRGPIATHVSACAAGALAVAHAASLVRRGLATTVVCGGTDSMVNPLGIGGMSRLGAPSPRPEADACRPFDRRRDGLVIGEGAAMFVVESLEQAAGRGARPLARILGWGSTQDGYKATAPRPDGSAAARAMRKALQRARLQPSDIGYINAHGTGTPLNDPAEVKAIRSAMGPAAETIPVSSIKGAIGHLMAAAGAMEIAACLLPFLRGILPGTTNHRERDRECDLDIIDSVPRSAEVHALISNSFGFGGQNASVILARHI